MKLGKCLDNQEDFEINVKSFLSTHTFLQGITGSAKTGALLKLLEEFRTEEFDREFGYIPIVIADNQDEFLDVPFTYGDFQIISKDSEYGNLFSVERASNLGKQVRESGKSVILKLSDFKTNDAKKFLSEFLEGFRIQDRQFWKPVVFMVDEADVFASRTEKYSVSREAIIDLAKRGRKEGISMILSTQNSASVHMDARSQCTNRIIGNTPEPAHRTACAKMLGLKTSEEKILYGLGKGEFFVIGEFTNYKLQHVQFDRATIKPPPIGIVIPNKTQKGGVNEQTSDEKKKISVIDVLEEKIVELQNQILNHEENQMTDKKIQKLKEDEYSHGFQACKELYDEKSIKKILRSKFGV